MADDISRILDQYGAEPDASNVSGMRERRQLSLLEPAPSQLAWAQAYPTLYDFLNRGLPLAMMALPGRSNVGASIGRDAVLANRYWQRALRERPYFGTGDITGGRPKVPVTNNTRNWAPYAESSAGLTLRHPDAFWLAEQPLPYPRFKYQGRGSGNDRDLLWRQDRSYLDALLKQREAPSNVVPFRRPLDAGRE